MSAISDLKPYHTPYHGRVRRLPSPSGIMRDVPRPKDREQHAREDARVVAPL